MNLSNIELLEEKINQIVQQLKLLKDKNQELEQENLEMKSVLEDRDKLIESFESKIDQLKQQAQDSSNFQEVESKIKDKISGMLEKLDQFESMV